MALNLINENGTKNVMYAGKVVDIVTEYGGYQSNTFCVVYNTENDSVEKIHYECDDSESWNLSWSKGTCEIDATPEVMAAYQEHCIREQRHEKAIELMKLIKKRHEYCAAMRINIREYNRLTHAFDSTHFEWIYTLMKTKNFRNVFRKHLDEQIRSWLVEENPKYAVPLSPRQLECLRPYRPW